MNSRIRALADQCYYDDNVRPDGSRISEQEFMIFDKQKFAELIVKECMNVARQQRNPANLNYKPSERFVEDLRQHFGVEE